MSASFRESGRFAAEYKWTRVVPVEVTTLDALIDRFGVPAFCKIDVEGFESEVVRGLTRAVPALSFEFGWDSLEQTRACLDHLTGIAPIMVNYSLGESMLWALPGWLEPKGLMVHLEQLTRERVGGDVYVRMSRPSV
jgi:hypothetical protein